MKQRSYFIAIILAASSIGIQTAQSTIDPFADWIEYPTNSPLDPFAEIESDDSQDFFQTPVISASLANTEEIKTYNRIQKRQRSKTTTPEPERYKSQKILQQIAHNAYQAIVFNQPFRPSLTDAEILEIQSTWTTSQKAHLIAAWIEKINSIFYHARMKPIENTLATITELNSVIAKLSAEPKGLYHIALLKDLDLLKTKLNKQCKTNFLEMNITPIQKDQLINKLASDLALITEKIKRVKAYRMGKIKQLFTTQYAEFAKFCNDHEILFNSTLSNQSAQEQNLLPWRFELLNVADFDPTKSFKYQCYLMKRTHNLIASEQDIQQKIVELYVKKLYNLDFDPQKTILSQIILFQAAGLDWKNCRNALKKMLQDQLYKNSKKHTS